MVCDPYANYVVQKIIDVADAEQREGIITEIRAHATQLKRYTFGKHIISRLEKISGKKM
jgi:pumilio RNA-binding family